MPEDKMTIIAAFQAHFKKGGGDYDEWFVGMHPDGEHALFQVHGVKQDDWWIMADTGSDVDARDVMEFFTKGLQTDGGSEIPGRFVYTYKKAPHTKP
jgi:hypothetical protein